MIRELEKRGCAEGEHYHIVLEYSKDFIELIKKKIKEVPENKVIFLYYLYDQLSKRFSESNVDQKKEIVNRLSICLKIGMPIGTCYNGEEDIKAILSKKEHDYEKNPFDLEESNRIMDIISDGWRFVILDMISNFLISDSGSAYLPRIESPKNTKRVKAEEKTWKFCKQYEILQENLRYSMETSVIVSHYRGCSHDK